MEEWRAAIMIAAVLVFGTAMIIWTLNIIKDIKKEQAEVDRHIAEIRESLPNEMRDAAINDVQVMDKSMSQDEITEMFEEGNVSWNETHSNPTYRDKLCGLIEDYPNKANDYVRLVRMDEKNYKGICNECSIDINDTMNWVVMIHRHGKTMIKMDKRVTGMKPTPLYHLREKARKDVMDALNSSE